MKFDIRILPLAEKMFAEVKDQRIRKTIANRIDKLAVDPLMQGKPLRDKLAGYYSVRTFRQRYRIVFAVDLEHAVIFIVGIGIRRQGSTSDIYERVNKLIDKIINQFE